MDILKNPIVIGLFASVITYVYLSWNNNKNNKKKKSKNKKQDVNLLIPLIVGLIVWFIIYGYVEYNSSNTNIPTQIITDRPNLHPLPIAPNASYRFTKDVIPDSSSEIKSFSLLTNGVNVPSNQLPDVMIDIFK